MWEDRARNVELSVASGACPAPSCCLGYSSIPASLWPPGLLWPSSAFLSLPQEGRILPWSPSLHVHFYLPRRSGEQKPRSSESFHRFHQNKSPTHVGFTFW